VSAESISSSDSAEAFSLGALEYEALRALIARYVSSDFGRARLDAVAPGTDTQAIEERHELIAEAMDYVRETSVPFNGLEAFPNSMARLATPGATLDVAEIEAVQDFISQVTGLSARWKSAEAPHPRLRTMVRVLPDLGQLGVLIGRAVRGGQIDENYSPALKRIRRELDRARERINRKFQAMIRDDRLAAQLQDEIVTQRNGRFVIPVRMDQKSRVNGIVHGTSSSGATVFMEPLEALEMNNDLVRLREEEEREVRRILGEISDRLRESFSELEQATRGLGEIEVVFAIARFGREFDCVPPRFTNGPITIRQGRHPLVESRLRKQGKTVVPLSVELAREHRILVISGPNAGGKTVVLKTIGLFALMAQSGIPVPAFDVVLPTFDRVLADIGDRQSIANELSTFSAHALAIARMTRVATADSLILLDEVGSSTEPNEGAALAVAVLEHFRGVGARTVATTHFNRLKMYAEITASVRNAAMEFDEATLEPTYRLIEGLAGQSSGIRIGERFGLPPSLIESARRSLDQNELDASRYVDELRRRVSELEGATRRLEEDKRSFENWKARVGEESRRDRQAESERAEAALKQVVADIRRQAAEQLKLLGAGAGTRFKRTLEKAEADARARFRGHVRGVPHPTSVGVEARAQADFREGMRVRVVSLGVTGAVLRTGASDAEVLVGNMKVRREFADLEPLEGPAAFEQTLPANVTVEMADKNLESNELKLIGKTSEEARDELDKFLDDAFLSRLAVVRVVHGHGMGILRKTVREVLAAHPHVERFEAAPRGEGGDGATLAYLKD